MKGNYGNREDKGRAKELRGEIYDLIIGGERKPRFQVGKVALSILELSTLQSIYEGLTNRQFQTRNMPRPERPRPGNTTQSGYRKAMREYLGTWGIEIAEGDITFVSANWYEVLADYMERTELGGK